MTALLAFLQAVVALMLAYIAWQNYALSIAGHRLKEDELRLALFDKRYEIFDAFKKLLLSFNQTGKVDAKVLSEFLISTADANFLFDSDIKKYRDEIWRKAREMIGLHVRLERASGLENRDGIATKLESLELWFSKQYTSLDSVFDAYLRFSTHQR